MNNYTFTFRIGNSDVITESFPGRTDRCARQVLFAKYGSRRTHILSCSKMDADT